MGLPRMRVGVVPLLVAPPQRCSLPGKGGALYFGSKTIGIHILRGVLGFAAFSVSLATLSTTIWPSLFLLPAAFYLLKGCPMCWMAGLIETITRSGAKHGESTQLQQGACCGASEAAPSEERSGQ